MDKAPLPLYFRDVAYDKFLFLNCIFLYVMIRMSEFCFCSFFFPISLSLSKGDSRSVSTPCVCCVDMDKVEELKLELFI